MIKLLKLFISAVELMHKKYKNNADYRELVTPSKDSFVLPMDQNDR